MIELHPSILTRDGKNQFVVLPYEEFVAVEKLLEDLEDIRSLREAKAAERDAATLSVDEVRNALGL